MTSIDFYQIDSFADAAFKGNPAAVCVLDAWIDDTLLLAIANENNLSETAFIVKSEDGSHYQLRWFTPSSEVELCGHATLAAGHVVLNFLEPDSDLVKFQTPLYALAVQRHADALILNFPKLSHVKKTLKECPKELLHPALVDVYEGNGTLVLVMQNEQDVASYQANLKFLVENRIFLSVTARASSDDLDFVSRFFAPLVGVDEDPVTGSVHCLLAPIWAEILDKNELQALQLSRRQGKIGIALVDDRVWLRGKSVCVIKGQLYPQGLEL